MIGFGQPETSDDFAARKPGQKFALLIAGSVGEDRIHHERALDAHDRAITGIDPFHFAGDQPIGDITQPCPALIFGQSGAEKSHGAHFRHDRRIKTLMPEIVAHARQQLVLAEAPCVVPHHPLFLREFLVEKQRIAPVENGVCHAGYP